MEIVFFHYHLNPGGVTSVLLNSISSLKKYNSIKKITILLGKKPDQSILDKIHSINPNVQYFYNKNLGYYNGSLTKKGLDKVYDSIKRFIKKYVNEKSIFHLHNPGLGKNPLITLVLYDLAKQGMKIINHIHDFAEDNRPDNYKFLIKIIENKFKRKLYDVLYPDFPNYFFAVLNLKDELILKKTGIKKEKIFYIPNNVSDIKNSITIKRQKEIKERLGVFDDKPVYLYPVRVIRRKNIGEFILLKLLNKDNAHFVSTKAPLNPVEFKEYEEWKNFCIKNKIDIVFDAGTKIDKFFDLVQSCDKVLTTSVTEGFGLVFIEPWQFNVPVSGRHISGITDDFLDAGIEYEMLYKNLWIPISVIDKDNFFKRYENYIKKCYKAYKMDIPCKIKNRIEELKIKKGKIDFADLDSCSQKKVIYKVKNDEKILNKIITANTWINKLFTVCDKTVIKNNKYIIDKKYSESMYGAGLMDAYKNFAGNVIAGNIKQSKNKVLEQFLGIENIKMVQK